MVLRSYGFGSEDEDVSSAAGVAPAKSGLRSYGFDETPENEAAGWADDIYGTFLNAGVGLTSGVEAAGALLETLAPEAGEALRQKGISATSWLQEKMPAEWQEAANKQWATMDGDKAAWADSRAWVGSIAQLVPYMLSTAGVGAGVGAAARVGLGMAEAASEKFGLGVAAGAAGGGEAAAGAGRAADTAGLSEDERLRAMRGATAVGVPAGLVLGKALGTVVGEGTGGIVRRTLTGAVGESIEEAGTQAGTEFGKQKVGLPVDYGAILESAVQGGVAGFGASGLVGGSHILAEKQQGKLDKIAKDAADTAETQATEQALGIARQKETDDKAAALLDSQTAKIDPAANRGKTIHDARITQLEEQAKKDKAALDAATTPGEKAKATGVYRTTMSNLTSSKLMRDAMVQVQQKKVVKPGEGALPEELAVPAGLAAKSDPSVWDIPVQAAQAKLDAAVAAEAKGRKKAGVKGRRAAVAAAQAALAKVSTQANALRMMRPEFEAEVSPEVEAAGITDDPTPPPPPTKAAVAKATSIKRSQSARAAADTRVGSVRAVPSPPKPKGSAEAQALTSSETVAPATPSTPTATPPTETPTAAAPAPAAGVTAPPAAAPGLVPSAPAQGAQPTPPTAPRQKGVRVAPSVSTAPQVQAAEVAAEVSTPAPEAQTATVAVETPQATAAKTVTKPAAKLKPKPLAKMTVSERIAHTLSTGPKTMTDMLAAMKDAFGIEKNPGMVALIERLERSVAASKMRVSAMVVAQDLPTGFQGLYDKQERIVRIDLAQAENAPIVMLHEIVHALTADRLKNPRFAQHIDDIREEAMKQWTERGDQPPVNEHPAFGNAAEFIAHVLSDTDFADTLAALPSGGSAGSLFKRFVNFLSDSSHMKTDTTAHSYFERLMDMIPNGTLLDAADSAAAREAVTALGMSTGYASLTTTFRSALRTSASTIALARKPVTGKSQVWQWALSIMPGGRIAQSYGYLGQGPETKHDVINRNEELIGLKEAAATINSATATNIAEYTKNANDTPLGAAPLNKLMTNARLWGLFPSKPLDDPANAYGKSLAGSAASYAELQTAWLVLSDEQRLAAQMMWDSSSALRTATINRMMHNTVRAMVGDDAADAFKAMLDDKAHARKVSHVPGIDITWQATPPAAVIGTELAKLGLDPKKHTALTDRLAELQEAVGLDKGPYSPLRRTGDFFAIVRSEETHNPTMTKAALDKLVSDNRVGKDAPGDLLITNTKDNKDGTYDVTYHYETVSSHATANEADAMVTEAAKSMADRGITVDRRTRQIRRDVLHEASGLKSASLEAMKANVRKAMPGPAGEQAVEQITKFYLEHLPDTSVRKSQLKARLVKGADSDVLAAYAAYTNGMSYMLAQMEYGPQLARNLNAHATEDIKALQKAGKADQADDLARIVDHLKGRDTENNRLMATDLKEDIGAIRNLWRRAPQLAGAWLLTGPGTLLVNCWQVPMVAGPHFAARHGTVASSAAILGSLRDVGVDAAKETGREGLRAVKSTYNVAKGGHARSFKDPLRPFYKSLIQHLDATEQAVIEKLVALRRIDYGLVADLRSLSRPQGKFWSAVEYVTNAAFIMPQAVETTNRVVTALASVRLNKAANPKATVDELARIATADIDQTQFNYANSNKSLLMQKEWLRQASTFKTYPVEMFYTVVHNMMVGFSRGGDAAEKSIARKTLAGILGTTLLASGVVGVLQFDPFYFVTVAMMALFADDDDPEAVLRSALSGFNDELVGMFLRGIPHGLHIADTGRMALPQVLPMSDLKSLTMDKEAKPEAYQAMLGETIGGAPGSLLVQSFQGAASMVHGDFAKARQQLLPKMFGANDLARAYNQASEGVKNTKGETVVDPDEISWKDTIVRAIGFEPAELSDARMKASTFQRRSSETRLAKRELMKAYGEAQLDGDAQAQKEALLDIRRFNAKHPTMAVTRTALVASITSRARSAALTERYGVNARTPGDRALVSEIEATY